MENVVNQKSQKKESVLVRADKMAIQLFEKWNIPKELWTIIKVMFGVAIVIALILMEMMGGSAVSDAEIIAENMRRRREEEEYEAFLRSMRGES